MNSSLLLKILFGISNSSIPINVAYIDPGTGSMLFTILIGLISALVYGLRGLFIKLRFKLSGGKRVEIKDFIPYAIYSEGKRYLNTFKPICDEFENRGINLVYYTSSEDDPLLNNDYKYVKCEYIGEGNKAFTKLNFLKADILLSTTPGLEVYQWKRSKDVKYYVHIPHMANDISCYRMFGLDYYDAILLSGDYQIDQIRKLEKLRNLPSKDIKIVGVTYLDELKKRLDKEGKVNNTDNKKTVLLAPSWGPSSILNKYGSKIIDELINTGYNIIVRPHPQSFTSEKELIDNLMNKYPNIEWNKDSDNFNVLNKSDILISDFSGVIFDFSLVFDKPVIYADTSFDYSPYDAYWLNEPLWTFKILPEIGEELNDNNIKDIKNLIDTCISSTRYKDGRDKARAETYQNEGKAAITAVDYLINKHKELEGITHES